MADEWKLTGGYFEACNCDVACPCVFLGPPTQGDCTVLVAWHIYKCNLGGMALDGLNVVLAAHSPGDMLQTKWKAALYLDERGSEAQRVRKLVDAAQDIPMDAALSMSTVSQQRIFDSTDLHEGVAAFLAKREPAFIGR